MAFPMQRITLYCNGDNSDNSDFSIQEHTTMRINLLLSFMLALVWSASVTAQNPDTGAHVADEVIDGQRQRLAEATAGQGFGPQAPRDLDSAQGNNPVVFGAAPAYTEMNLCNIHFHKGAEHSGGEFTEYAGNGDGRGYGTGFLYSGELTEAELEPLNCEICSGEQGSLVPGDTIEVHYVHTTAQVTPGPTLNACLNESIANPQLRVETQVYVLVNDSDAEDFGELTRLGERNGRHQALNIPADTGTPIQYAGSTTGPDYNTIASPLQVSWSVRPEVIKVDASSVGEWCEDNVFDEDHAHGVRNLVINPDLLSPID